MGWRGWGGAEVGGSAVALVSVIDLSGLTQQTSRTNDGH